MTPVQEAFDPMPHPRDIDAQIQWALRRGNDQVAALQFATCRHASWLRYRREMRSRFTIVVGLMLVWVAMFILLLTR